MHCFMISHNKFPKNTVCLVVVMLFLVLIVFLSTNDVLKRGGHELAASLSRDVEIAPTAALVENHVEYKNDRFGFSLQYPQEFTVEIFADYKDTETIVIQREDGKRAGFQIFVSWYGEELRKERILNDLGILPHLENLREITIGDRLPAFAFNSRDASIGKTKEVWFSHNSYLYQITTYAHFSDELDQILTTWRFEICAQAGC